MPIYVEYLRKYLVFKFYYLHVVAKRQWIKRACDELKSKIKNIYTYIQSYWLLRDIGRRLPLCFLAQKEQQKLLEYKPHFVE
eukprot:snap_masked-scaffold_50-processed-gene-0.10-mRNA-1 protein AED:0.40 eAED:0.49 QI:0/0/0/1/1/1/3/0/81